MHAAQILRAVRQRSGLSLRALSRRAGTSHSTLAAYEAGRVVPTVDTLNRIVRAAGYSVAATLTRDVGASDAARSRELIDVLELAAMLPARRRPDELLPIFGRT